MRADYRPGCGALYEPVFVRESSPGATAEVMMMQPRRASMIFQSALGMVIFCWLPSALQAQVGGLGMADQADGEPRKVVITKRTVAGGQVLKPGTELEVLDENGQAWKVLLDGQPVWVVWTAAEPVLPKEPAGVVRVVIQRSTVIDGQPFQKGSTFTLVDEKPSHWVVDVGGKQLQLPRDVAKILEPGEQHSLGIEFDFLRHPQGYLEVQVTRVYDGGAAAAYGLARGDVIERVDQKLITTPEEFTDRVRTSKVLTLHVRHLSTGRSSLVKIDRARPLPGSRDAHYGDPRYGDPRYSDFGYGDLRRDDSPYGGPRRSRDLDRRKPGGPLSQLGIYCRPDKVGGLQVVDIEDGPGSLGRVLRLRRGDSIVRVGSTVISTEVEFIQAFSDSPELVRIRILPDGQRDAVTRVFSKSRGRLVGDYGVR